MDERSDDIQFDPGRFRDSGLSLLYDEALVCGDRRFREVLEAFPAAVYIPLVLAPTCKCKPGLPQKDRRERGEPAPMNGVSNCR